MPREFAAWQRLLGDADPTVSRAVPRLDLLDGDANVLPSRYVTVRAEASAQDLARVTERLTRLYAQIGRGLPMLRGARNATGKGPPMSRSPNWSGSAR